VLLQSAYTTCLYPYFDGYFTVCLPFSSERRSPNLIFTPLPHFTTPQSSFASILQIFKLSLAGLQPPALPLQPSQTFNTTLYLIYCNTVSPRVTRSPSPYHHYCPRRHNHFHPDNHAPRTTRRPHSLRRPRAQQKASLESPVKTSVRPSAQHLAAHPRAHTEFHHPAHSTCALPHRHTADDPFASLRLLEKHACAFVHKRPGRFCRLQHGSGRYLTVHAAHCALSDGCCS